MCEDQLLPLAVNIMDRFLCVCAIKRQQLQLLGATCLLIASKVCTTNLIPVELLSAYTDYSVTYDHIVVSKFFHTILIFDWVVLLHTYRGVLRHLERLGALHEPHLRNFDLIWCRYLYRIYSSTEEIK